MPSHSSRFISSEASTALELIANYVEERISDGRSPQEAISADDSERWIQLAIMSEAFFQMVELGAIYHRLELMDDKLDNVNDQLDTANDWLELIHEALTA